MVCACAHGLELGRNPVGAHIVRPSPCGKSCYGIYRKAPERSRPFPTMLDLRPVLTPNSYFLTLNQHSIMLNLRFFHCFVLALCQAMPYLLQ